jgi:DNA-nicking Smr family endonuclease
MSDFLNKEDKALFQQAMRDVSPLKKGKKTTSCASPPKALPPKQTVEQETSHQVALSDYIATPVFAETILSYHRPYLPKKKFNDLSRGLIPWTASLDLHGLNTETARHALIRFIQSHANTCVLVIHGKGEYQRGQAPVLKNLVYRWLLQLDEVLGLHSARGRDGGNGAVYVLLRKKHLAKMERSKQ